MTDRLRKGGISCGLLLLFGMIILVLFLVSVGAYLSVGDRVQPVDAIVVLSGDEGDRVIEAADWFLKGYGQYLIITKTDNEEIGEQKTYSEKLMRIAVIQGVPQDSILFSEGMAGNTFEEAQAVLELVKIRNIRSILIITDTFHTRRAKLIFNRVFEGEDIEISIHGLKNSWYKPYNWFLSKDGWKQTISEFGGIFVLN